MDLRRGIEQVAQEYRADGYAVVVAPTADQRPAFAADTAIEMVATRADGNAVVAVAPTRVHLAARAEALGRVAERAAAHPGWRLDVAVLGPAAPLAVLAARSREPTDEQLAGQLAAAEAAAAGGPAAALTLAVAALEAALRRRLADPDERYRLSPAGLLDAVYGDGLGRVDPAEYELARQAMAVRDLVAHGFTAPGVDPAVVGRVVALARRLAAEAPSAAA